MLAGPVKRLSYDYLVMATGSTYTVPMKQPKNKFRRSTTELMMAEVRQQIENANSILIVGGGATGAGVAGEIKSKFPDKVVTIIEGKDKLVGTDNVREKFRARLLKFLKRKDVNVVLGERLTERLNGNSFERRALRTDKRRELVSDIQLLCGGFNPTTELIKNLDESLVTPRGLIKVNSKLQLDDSRYSNIYALGDANNNSAPKHMLFASQQGTHLGSELALVARNTQANVSKDFPKVEVSPAMIPLGPDGGVSQLPILGGVVYGNFVTRTFKSKEYFASFAWKALNAEVPIKAPLIHTLSILIVTGAPFRYTFSQFACQTVLPSPGKATMCTSLRDMASAILKAMTWLNRPPSEVNDTEATAEDAKEAVIVHTLRSQSTSQRSLVRFITTIAGVQVSLTAAVTARRDAVSGLILQHTTATWTFSADQHFVELVQEPTSIVGIVTSSHFRAYAVDRLAFAARRHAEWTTGSNLSWTLRVVLSAASIMIKQLVSIVPKQELRNEEIRVAQQVTKKTAQKLRRPRTAGINPRYLDYEQTSAYSSRRKKNLERRHALESV